VLHWTIAIIILGQIAVGLYMKDLPNASTVKFDLYQLHKSFGVSVLVLSLLRLVWRFMHKPPALPVEMPEWQKTAAGMTHWGFYALIVLTPLAGLAVVSVSPTDIPTKWFGIIPVPHLPFMNGISDRANAEDIFKEVHEVLAFSILFLLVLHVGAVLKHGFINRDGVLRSMAPAGAGQLVVILGILAGFGAGALFYLFTPAPAPVASAFMSISNDAGKSSGAAIWIVDTEKSRLVFIGEEKGRRFEGVFGEYQATINFDPADLDASKISVDIATRSIATGDSLRDGTIPGKEWFDIKEYPSASFSSETIRNVGGDAYEADGVLRIKDYEHPITVAFTLIIDGDNATAQGGVELIRTDYGLGLGSGWLDDEDVGLNVRAEFEIYAMRKK
jgi:cytochrome b561/polyisoprenoid-binding protein YceI